MEKGFSFNMSAKDHELTELQIASSLALWREFVDEDTTQEQFDAMSLPDRLEAVSTAFFWEKLDCAEN